MRVGTALVLVPFIVTLAAEFVMEWMKEQGYYANPSAKVDKAMVWLSALTDSWGFAVGLGCAIGAVVAAWGDYLLRRQETPRAAPSKAPQADEWSDIEALKASHRRLHEEIARRNRDAEDVKRGEFVTGQRIGVSFTSNQGVESAVVYKAYGAKKVRHLQICLDLARGIDRKGKMHFTRMKIEDRNDIIRDKVFTTIIMNRELIGDQYTFTWNTQDKPAPPFSIGRHEGRIALIGDDESEQYLYFLTIPTHPNIYGILYFEIIFERLNLALSWEGQP